MFPCYIAELTTFGSGNLHFGLAKLPATYVLLNSVSFLTNVAGKITNVGGWTC